MNEPSTQAGVGRELISFRIGDQEFCVDIMSVREIRGWIASTPLPHAPSYIKGMINLRGVILPIIDLAKRLNKPVSDLRIALLLLIVNASG